MNQLFILLYQLPLAQVLFLALALEDLTKERGRGGGGGGRTEKAQRGGVWYEEGMQQNTDSVMYVHIQVNRSHRGCSLHTHT